MLAEMLASKGRKGDDDVAHLTTGELIVPPQVLAAMPELESLLMQAFTKAGADIEQYRVGGGDDSVNPETGMKEFGWNDDEGDTGSGWGGPDGNMATNDFGGNDGGHETNNYYQQEPNRGPVPGWSPTPGQNSPRSIVGNAPSEIGGGNVGAFGFSPAQYSNPMSGDTHYGVGFNPRRAIGSIAGSLLGGPLGGLAGGFVGGKMADTRFGFPGMDSYSYGIGQQMQQQGPRNQGGDDNLILARRLMGQ